MLLSIKAATETHTAEIAEIKSMTTQTEANVKKVSEQHASMTPTAPAMAYIHEHRRRTYANAAAGTPISAKRKRVKSPTLEKPQFPAAKIGQNENVNGLQAVPKIVRSDVKPKFAKALFLSRINPATTSEKLSDYIVSNTPVTDPTKFKVHKMVKKGVDESTLRFVSFKIEMDAAELDILDDAKWWPVYSQVREFLLTPPNQLGNYFPALNANEKPAKNNANEVNTDGKNVNEEMETA